MGEVTCTMTSTMEMFMTVRMLCIVYVLFFFFFSSFFRC